MVVENKTDGPKKYAVRERKGVKYVSGSNPQPINGAVIGHIIDNMYVPLLEETICSGPEELSYGSSVLFRNLSTDILEDLLRTFSVEDAYTIISAAAMRVIKPSASYNRVSQYYRRCFLSRFFPAQVGKNHISDLLERIGMDRAKRRMFFSLRIQRMKASHNLLINGYLKTNSSKINDLAHYSHKAEVKGCRNIFLIYAYDLEAREIVASHVFPGNSPD